MPSQLSARRVSSSFETETWQPYDEELTCMIFSLLSLDADFCVWSAAMVSGSVGRRTYTRAELFSRGTH